MFKKFLVLGLVSLSPLTSFSKCELPQGEVLKIGCSYHCDVFYRFRLTMTSMMMGYKTKIVDMRNMGEVENALKEVDAVLLPGGADIDPKYYMGDITPELRDYTEKNLHLVKFTEEGRKRDPFEYSLVKHYSEDETFKDLPMLGICRGLQMMSVAQGIPLYLDIKTELGIRNRKNVFDRIMMSQEEPTVMNSIYRKNVKALKLHHQGIRVSYYQEHQADYPNTKVTAYSNNGKVAEAIEYTHRPALGVQYHPERSFSGASVPVFRWFLNKACEYKTSTKKEI
jgi:gamma-glutamyl-gamma-aminobutyrate hydrolase PuuD